MDRHTPQQRSKNMRAIKSTATKAEITLAKALWSLGSDIVKTIKQFLANRI